MFKMHCILVSNKYLKHSEMNADLQKYYDIETVEQLMFLCG